jgi:hypothetical protein
VRDVLEVVLLAVVLGEGCMMMVGCFRSGGPDWVGSSCAVLDRLDNYRDRGIIAIIQCCIVDDSDVFRLPRGESGDYFPVCRWYSRSDQKSLQFFRAWRDDFWPNRLKVSFFPWFTRSWLVLVLRRDRG